MDRDEVKRAITLALLDIERAIGIREVPLMTLWDRVQAHLRMSDYGVALRELRDSGHALVDVHTITLTDVGRLAAERANGQRRQGYDEDEHIGTQRPVDEAAGGSGPPRRPERSVNATDCSGAEVPIGRARADWLLNAARLGLSDVVMEYGYHLPHFALLSCIAFRLTQAGSSSLGADSSEALRALVEHQMVAVIGCRTRLLSRGLRAVSMVQTMKRLSLQK